MIHIAIDAMGGDDGLKTTVPGALRALSKHADLTITLVGDSARIQKALQKHQKKAKNIDGNRVHILHADQVVAMDESAASAVRTKKSSSMRKAIDLVKAGTADGCVSAGNTGALMATARFVLKTIPGIDRPAICTAMPCHHGRVYALDLGANIDSTAAQLVQFGLMGTAFAEAEGVDNPRVGLMNVGVEEIKGVARTQAAHKAFSDMAMNYQGYVEGHDLFMGDVDVVVMDGLEGNVALKTAEGLASFVRLVMKQSLQQGWYGRLAGLLLYPVLKRIRARLNAKAYNGACLLGLRKLVVKSHGKTSVKGYASSIDTAYRLIKKGMIGRIETRIQTLA